MRWKPILLRTGWMLFIISLLLPTLLVRQDSQEEAILVSGLDFVIQSLQPGWWQTVPLALPIAAANVCMIVSVLLPGLCSRHHGRTWALGIPCLLGAAAGTLIPHLFAVQVGYAAWLLALICTGIGALMRLPKDY